MTWNDEFVRIFRGVRRRFNSEFPLDSYPFLSGDSYFYSCESYYASGRIEKIPSIPNRISKAASLFVKIGDVKEFKNYLETNSDTDFTKFTLVMHNGDNPVDLEDLNFFSNRFEKIFSVNLMSSIKNATAIPIGLENKRYFTNGVPTDFARAMQDGLRLPNARSNLILQAFSIHTNKSEREPCAFIGKQMGAKVLNNATPSMYRAALSDSKFVLSPAGNGFDCHRTWEALYLGAIPIVKRAYWPFDAIKLPVLIVDEWEDLLHIDLEGYQLPQGSRWNDEIWGAFFMK